MNDLHKLAMKTLADQYLEELAFLKQLYPNLPAETHRDMLHSLKLDAVLSALDVLIDGDVAPLSDADRDELI